MTNFNLLYQSTECSKKIRKNGTEQKEIYDKFIEINSLETFKEAVIHNHTMCMYKNYYRKGDNWQGANVLYADIDSGTTIEEFIDDFKDYEFFIATSKSHLKDKDGTGAHPRFHIYFPIGGCTKVESFKKALIKLCNSKPYFDKAVKDVGRYFNASSENCEIYYNEGKSILDYIFSIPDTKEIEKEMEKNEDYHTDFTIDEVYQYFNKWGMIRTIEGYYNINTKQWIDERQLLHLTKELKIKNENKEEKKDIISIGEYWINNQKDNSHNPLYNAIEFRPDLPYGRNDLKENYGRIWNTFKGFDNIEGFEGDITPILNHIKEVICDNNDEVYAYVMNWLAHLFQKPYEKPRVAIGVRGERQIGKGVIFDDLMKNLLKEMEYITTDFSCIDRSVNNNIEIRDKLLIYFNEVGWMDDKNDIGKMNTLITDRTIKYRELRHTPFEGRSFHRVIITTNADRIVEHKDNSVRWLLMTANPKYKGNTEYFNNLLECINNCYGSFMNYLLKIELSDWNYNKIPLTETALEQQELSLNSAERFCMELQEGTYFPATHISEDDDLYKSSYIYSLYQLYCNENGYKPFTHTNLGIHLKKNFEKVYKKDGKYYKVSGLRVTGCFNVIVEKNKNILNFEQQPKNNPKPDTPDTNILKFKPEPNLNLIKQMKTDLKSKSDINDEAKIFISGKIPNIEHWKHDNTPSAVGSLKAHGYTREQVEDIFSKYTDHILSLALLIYDTDYDKYKKEKKNG